MCNACKKRYRGSQTGLCSFCGKVIKLDMARHVANYHLELAQLWCCPVSWCTQWKGMPQDCADHIGLAHAMPATVKAADLGKWFPPWTVSRETWFKALKPHASGVSMDALLFSQSDTPLSHHYRVFGRGGAHASLRGKFMSNLRAFSVRAEAEFADGTRLTTPHVVQSLVVQYPLVRRRCPLPRRPPRMSHHLYLARTCTDDGPLYRRRRFACRTLPTRISSQLHFSQCSS